MTIEPIRAFNHLTTALYLIIHSEILESDSIESLQSLKLKIRIVFTATTPINPLSNIYWLKELDVYQNQVNTWNTFNSFYEEILEEFWTKLSKIVVFTTTVLTFPSPSINWQELAEALTKNCLQSGWSNFEVQRPSSIISSNKKWISAK